MEATHSTQRPAALPATASPAPAEAPTAPAEAAPLTCWTPAGRVGLRQTDAAGLQAHIERYFRQRRAAAPVEEGPPWEPEPEAHVTLAELRAGPLRGFCPGLPGRLATGHLKRSFEAAAESPCPHCNHIGMTFQPHVCGRGETAGAYREVLMCPKCRMALEI